MPTPKKAEAPDQAKKGKEGEITLQFTVDEDACLKAALSLLRKSMPQYQIEDNMSGYLGNDPKVLGYSILASATTDKYRECVARRKLEAAR